jgi:hypothetical protein
MAMQNILPGKSGSNSSLRAAHSGFGACAMLFLWVGNADFSD